MRLGATYFLIARMLEAVLLLSALLPLFYYASYVGVKAA